MIKLNDFYITHIKKYWYYYIMFWNHGKLSFFKLLRLFNINEFSTI